MATPYLKSWTPTTTYEFKLQIGNKDYSNDLYKITIRSAINTPYQSIEFDVFLDQNELLSEKIYGQEPIKFSVILKGDIGYSQEQVDFDLMFANTDTDFSMAQQIAETDQIKRTPITFVTISRPAFKTMTSLVNNVYFASTPETIVKEILSNTDAQVEYDTNGKNQTVLDQFVVPPTTVYKTIRYLDRTYGIFDGIMAAHCSHDNVVKIQNLSKKIGTSQAFTIYSLATNADQSKILEMTDPSKFYTKVPVVNLNRTNTIMGAVAPRNRYIVKPSDSLYDLIDVETETIAKENGIISPNIANQTNIYYDKEAVNSEKRIAYHTNQTGYEKNESFIKANLAKTLGDLSMLQIELRHNLPILNLMNVGEAVNFLPQVSAYEQIKGKYVLKGSEIGWVRSKVWESWARVVLMRTNIGSS
jgi:hypothetical protein